MTSGGSGIGQVEDESLTGSIYRHWTGPQEMPGAIAVTTDWSCPSNSWRTIIYSAPHRDVLRMTGDWRRVTGGLAIEMCQVTVLSSVRNAWMSLLGRVPGYPDVPDALMP